MPAQLAKLPDDAPVVGSPVDQVVVGGQVRDALRDHAERAFPHEACGLLIGRVDENGVVVTRAGYNSAFILTAAVALFGAFWWAFAVPRIAQVKLD